MGSARKPLAAVAWAVRRACRAVCVRIPAVTLYVVPEFVPPTPYADAETARLTLATLAAVFAFSRSLDAGPQFLLYSVLQLAAVQAFAVAPWHTWSLVILRGLLFHSIVLSGRFPRKTADMRFREHKARLVSFFSTYDAARIREADALLLEYLGNEPLLFAKLEANYARPEPVVLPSSGGDTTDLSE
ncbi:hypothetical protein ACHHYP_01141 [Achlya hypogyna]|uniref:Uncharacterized protein n=1 Tax=Achlya hypogyna TaxID=1202772 RepID=A0A1V9Z9B3_ACHHY|nr:hypothetical protein ACHHYP_01141 [Achlya hypogyna]